MAWQPPTSDAVDSGWQPPASDAVQSQPIQPTPAPSTSSVLMDALKAPYKQYGILPTPGSMLRKGLDVAGTKVAEAGGKAGYPVSGAVAGTAVQMAPDIMMSLNGLQGLYKSPNLYAQGITKTPQEIGQLMGQGEEAAGVSNQLPVRSGLSARFPKTASDVMTATPSGDVIPPSTSLSQVSSVNPTSYPKNTNSLLNFMQQRITQFGDKISPQELSDYKRILPEMFQKGEIMRGTPQYALASDLNSQVADLYAKAIPGRAELNQAYGVSKTLHPEVMNAIKNYVQKYGKSALKEAIGVGLGVAGGSALKDLFR